MPDRPPGTVPVGYAALVERYKLEVTPHHRASYVAQRGGFRELRSDALHQFVYPTSYSPGEEVGGHLEFALKYDGTNLEILKAVFFAVDPGELTDFISRKPTGKYVRRIWFFYEYLTGQRLPIPDLTSGNYVGALDADEYYVSLPVRVPRQRINDNLLGVPAFCPIVRRTQLLTRNEELELDKKLLDVLRNYDRDTINRAITYLYTKETLSSFLIEREKPSPDRAERFAAMLKRAPQIPELTHDVLLEVRNLIVDRRYVSSGYRTTEVYVGESLSFYHQKVHFIGAPAERLHEFMDGLLACYERMRNSDVHPVVTAAVISFGFVFIHPFEDGNGRTHRFLIHYVLAKNGFTPEGVIFPVSSTMQNNIRDYDACLESFSKPTMELSEFELNDVGKLTIIKSSIDAYRYLDATRMAEYLFYCIQETIAIDFKQELDFMVAYRNAKERLRQTIDMPDRKLDLFIKLCLQNGGRLSKSKYESHFPELSEGDVSELGEIVRTEMGQAAIAFERQR